MLTTLCEDDSFLAKSGNYRKTRGVAAFVGTPPTIIQLDNIRLVTFQHILDTGMYVSMYVCLYVFIYACMHVCMSVRRPSYRQPPPAFRMTLGADPEAKNRFQMTLGADPQTKICFRVALGRVPEATKRFRMTLGTAGACPGNKKSLAHFRELTGPVWGAYIQLALGESLIHISRLHSYLKTRGVPALRETPPPSCTKISYIW
jgi:hypothetical protein